MIAKLSETPARGSRCAASTRGSGIWPRCGRCWTGWTWPGSSTRWCRAAPTRPRRWAPTWRWRARTGSWTRARSWLRRLVGHHGRAAVGEGWAGPRWTTAGSGTRWTASARPSCAAIETRLGRAMVDRVRAGPVRAGAGHDQLRHLHRHGNDAGADRAARQGQAETHRPAAGRAGAGGHPRRRGAADQRTPIPATGPTSPSSPRSIDELVARYRDLVDRGRVADRGLRRRAELDDNHALVEAAGIGFVGSLPPSDHPDLLAIPDRATGPSTPTATPG